MNLVPIVVSVRGASKGTCDDLAENAITTMYLGADRGLIRGVVIVEVATLFPPPARRKPAVVIVSIDWSANTVPIPTPISSIPYPVDNDVDRVLPKRSMETS